eukprot:CAMPEP_0198275846 /NCGR_PEP_ID=MMETSP1447-20131203/64996_1 /TAXON_ID=420782 /ORGANISM="Chaetoceros dichaeta, Strain CCMP1751" /LENGTH=427 /DNA_ID=CAMNT_0043970751 /DNA_START=485 /DNA_END=1768 /DNA_ORIENTATION=+
MSIFNWGSTKLANRIESMRLAEGKLMSFANRFGGNTTEQLELFDTPIPRASVPLHGDQRCQLMSCRSETEDTSDFIMHGVKVTSNDTENRLDEGAPLVLLHGYANGALYYYRNLVGLSNNHFGGVVYALDMLGWGLSSRPSFKMKSVEGCDDVDMAEQFFVESLEAWRKAHKLEKMTLGGHSLGGYMSVAYCEKYPQHVDRLILISPAGVPHEETNPSTRNNLPLKVRILISLAAGLWRSGITPASFIKSLPEGRGTKLVAGYVENRLPAVTCVDERASLVEYLYANAVLPGSGADCLNKILKPMAYAKKPTIDRIPLLNVRDIAIIYGQNDWMDPKAGLNVKKRCEELRTSGKEETPKISVFGVKDAGHLLMLENWEEFNSAVILAGGGGKRLSKQAHLPFTCSQSDESDTGFFNKPRFAKNKEAQ